MSERQEPYTATDLERVAQARAALRKAVGRVREIKRERDAYRDALVPFARAVTVMTLDENWTNVLVPCEAIERARELLAGEATDS